MVDGRRALVDTVLVVVPAHDEEELVGACLDSVDASIAAVAQDVRRVVALDACGDRTAAEVAARGWPTVVVDARCVGTARRVGVEHLLAGLDRDRWPGTLVLGTDADCVVPAGWVADHVAAAARADVVLGEVRPQAQDLDRETLAAWAAARRRERRHRQPVHGANLGVRLPAYLSAGGFPDQVLHEDVALVRAARAGGARCVRGPVVVTSGRREGRTPGGFAGYLRALDGPQEGVGA